MHPLALVAILSTLVFASNVEGAQTFYEITSGVARKNWESLDKATQNEFMGFLKLIHAKYFIENYGKKFSVEEFQKKVLNGEVTQSEVNQMEGNATLFTQEYNNYVAYLFKITPESVGMTKDQFCKEVPKICDKSYVPPAITAAPPTQSPDSTTMAATTLKPGPTGSASQPTTQAAQAEAAKAENHSNGAKSLPMAALCLITPFLLTRL